MFNYSKITKLTVLLLSLTLLNCSSDDSGCKVDFDCPGAEICVDTKCVLAVCTSDSDCIDPAFVCELNQCVLGAPPVTLDASVPPEDQSQTSDEGVLEDVGVADTANPNDTGTETTDTSAPDDVPVIEDTPAPEDTNVEVDVPVVADQGGPEDTEGSSDAEDDPDTDEPGDEGVETDEGFTQCGEVSIVGCCSGNKAYTCGSTGLSEIDCNLDGGACGWAGGFYGCNSDGLADPDGNHPFTCPGETCEGTCDGKACGTDGCGNSCGVCEGGLECVVGTGQCEEDEEGPEVFYFGGGGAQEIFQTYCNGCHSDSNSGNHNITSTFADANKPSNSCPGFTVAECSLMRMENGSMPPFPTSFEPEELALIENWVEGGALAGDEP